ncbi:sigma-70 family RNA polymerase sigma factor [Streptomyces sp. NPDC001633]|uniref:BACON domain-containing protein n=1 Tax=Streptomyces sp. NPDC001633 TaxID=3364595 RepID=UPI0036BAC7FA
MSSRPEHPTHSTGVHRSRGDDRRRSRPQSAQPSSRPLQPPAPGVPEEPGDGYQPYVDGLFTYCLSVLCEHDAATAVLGEMLALAERHHHRRPADPALHRAWLYALARWACLRRLAERTGSGIGTGSPSGTGSGIGTVTPASTSASTSTGPSTGPATATGSGPAAAREGERRQRELAVLAWPEAAGTSPGQREALELSVRHRLSADEVAAVLGADPIATRALLATASCEVERTRAALAVVESGRCKEVAQLAGDSQVLLGAALSRELVRHVDDCATCRRTAERATAPGSWPGTAPAARGSLPLVAAPQEAVLGALAAARRSRTGRADGSAAAGRRGRSGGANGSPRYDRNGFPAGPPPDRSARRRRLRARALTTTVVATVIAAPVLALWAAYRGAPATGETAADGMPSVTANDTDAGARLNGRYENAGNARTTPSPATRSDGRTPDVSVAVIGADGTPLRPGEADRTATGPGRLTIAAQPSGGTTAITLSASGGEPVHWTATPGAAWLQMSQTAGYLRPGQSTTVTVYVDHDREPAGRWRTRIAIHPGGTAVTLEGYGGPATGPQGPSPAGPSPSRPPHTPTPTDPTPTAPAPSPSRTSPTPGPSDPSPTASPSGPTATSGPTPFKPSDTPSNTTRPAR